VKFFKSSDVKPFQTPGREIVHQYTGRLEKHGKSSAHSLARMTLEPGCSSEPHSHRFAEESFLVTRGQAFIQVDAQRVEVGPGDCVFVQPGERHTVINRGEGLFECVIATSPPWCPEDSV
jgi:mannose-6-phosphate isomerase-like protein (cupin superfamily)